MPDFDGRILRVKKTGQREGRRFEFTDEGPAPPIEIPEAHRVDLEAYANEIDDIERCMRLLAALPSTWCFN